MRWVVYGAGAVGGVVGARLVLEGEEVVFIARGEHAHEMRRSGLRLDSPTGSVEIPVEVALSPGEARIGGDDVVLLAVKSQHTAEALLQLRDAAAPSTPVVCLQNGVDNERAALRLFEHVHAVCVMCPTAHLEPGVVEAHSSPVTGILDIGRYPAGVDPTTELVASAFARATFISEPRPDVMRWKYAKLLSNLGNAAEALCGPSARRGELVRLARAEGAACLRAARIDVVPEHDDAARRADVLRIGPVRDRLREGGSTWQSLQRVAGTVETDHLNGEIVLLGRWHGVPTPVNALLQRMAHEVARERRPPGSVTEAELLAVLATQGSEPGGDGRLTTG